MGIANGIDDNVAFGLIKKHSNRVAPDNNYYYLRSKAYTDAVFTAVYTVAEVGSGVAAVQAFVDSGVLGTMAIAASPTGVGAAALGAVAVEELARGVALSGVSFLSGKMATRAKNNVKASTANLEKTNQYKIERMTDEEAIEAGITDVTAAEAKAQGRPSWKKSELDIEKENYGYLSQESFKDGIKVPYGTSGSVRPDLYKNGQSIEVKNYNITTSTGRNSVANNIGTQYLQRINNLPQGTKQTVILDIRGQNHNFEMLSDLYSKIEGKTGGNVVIKFKLE